MQAPDLPNKRYVVYMNSMAEAPYHINYSTFDQAWEGAKQAFDNNKTPLHGLNGPTMHMLHSSAAECLAANPRGVGGSAYVRRWVWGEYESSTMKHSLGDPIIIELRW